MRQNKTVTALTAFVTLAIVALAAGSFVLSFNALLHLAIDAGGIPPRLAPLWPLIVDLSLVIYTATLLTSQLNKWSVWFPALLVVFYASVTIAGNILHAPATPVGWFIAALPPLSLILATECLRTLLKHTVERAAVLASIAALAKQQETLTRQVASAQTRLDNLRQEIKTEKTGNIAKMQAKAQQARQEKIAARRAEVGQLLEDGASQPEMAETLGVSVRTIRNDIRQLSDNGRGTE